MHNSMWHVLKKERTEYFYKHIYKNKLIVCTSCNGSGWYDNCREDGSSIPCGGCEGTGKCKER